MEHLWTIPCQTTIVDQETNALSLINVLEHIHFEVIQAIGDVTALPIPFSIVTLWERSDSEQPEISTCRIQIVSPNGQTLSSNDYETNLNNTVRFRFTTRYGTLPYDGDGVYKFVVSVLGTKGRWKKAGEANLRIKVVMPS